MVPDTWHVSFTCRHVIYTWFCNSWTLWATHKCEGSKRVKNSPEIQWACSKPCDTCPSRVDTWRTHDFVTPEPFELHISVRGQKGLEIHQKFNGHVPSAQPCETCPLHVDTRCKSDFENPEPFELHTSIRGQNGSRHVTRVDTWFTCDFVTPDPFELQTSVRGQNEVKFHWESS